MPPWGCNYTTNINLEMNYWHAETANLGACTEPLFRLIREAAEKGRRVARDFYGCRGWCLHHNTDLWRFTNHRDRAGPAGATGRSAASG